MSEAFRIETGPAGAAANLQRIFELQRGQRWTIGQTDAAQRAAKLDRLHAEIEKRREAVAEALQRDFRKSRAEAELGELHPTLTELRHAATHVADWMRPRRVGTPITLRPARSELRLEPRGVALVLAPWNYPFYLALGPLAGAIAAGNCVVLKPSEKTPATAAVIREIVAACFDPAEIAVVEGGPEIAQALLALPFDHVFFTGSTRIGRKVMEAASRTLASVTLELGGKSPAIVDESADVELAARRIAWGKFLNAGQTCVAPDYVLVHESRERAFLDALRATIARFYGATDDERAKSPDFPRIIDVPALRRIRALVDRSVEAGARVETGGQSDEAQRYFAPTVLSGVQPGHAIMEEEIFGPVLPVLAVRSRAEALERVRRGDKPLALYVFATRDEAIEEVLRGTTAGGTCVNDTVIHLINPELPFGGVGASGMGSYHGEAGFRAFSHERSVLVQSRFSLVEKLYPPYGSRAGQLISRVLRLFE